MDYIYVSGKAIFFNNKVKTFKKHLKDIAESEASMARIFRYIFRNLFFMGKRIIFFSKDSGPFTGEDRITSTHARFKIEHTRKIPEEGLNLIRVEKAVKDYRLGKTIVHALKGADLTVKAGEFLAIAGPSGSGKTTLLNIVSGIEKPTSGKVYLDDLELAGRTQDELADIRATRIGFVFQNFNLLPVLTAIENVEYPLLISGKTTRKDSRKMAEKALDLVGLAKFAKHKPLELSGGQRQRVAIARAMVINPSVILADEPTANLDHKTGEEILALMKKINKEQKTTFIFSTHDQKIMDMADRVVKLWDGVIADHTEGA